MIKEVALIKSEAVVNVVLADDEFIAHIANEFDHVVDITGMSPRPGIGWSYVDGQFRLEGFFENGEIIEVEQPAIEEPPTE